MTSIGKTSSAIQRPSRATTRRVHGFQVSFIFLPHSGALLVLLSRCHYALATPSAAPVHLPRPLSIPTNPRSSMRAPAL